MLNTEYQRFLKLFGKLCYAYDNATMTTLTQQLSRTWEQIGQASQEFENQPMMVTFSPYVSQWNNIITTNSNAMQGLALNAAIAELVSIDFTNKIITGPGLTALTNTSNVVIVLQALAAEMTSDGVTLSTAGTTGLVNFFNHVSALRGGTDPGIPTNVAPTFNDGTFCVLTIVP